MTEHEPPAEQPPYWTDDQPLGAVYLGHHPRLVHARSHHETETFRGRGSETLFTLTDREGDRGYLQSRLYIHAPEASTREQRIADAQAWFYPADQCIVLWELILLPPFNQHAEPREDLVLRSLWSHYERFLAARFPANELLTTWEDTYDRQQWAAFLIALGYRQTGPAVFRKAIDQPPTIPERPYPPS